MGDLRDLPVVIYDCAERYIVKWIYINLKLVCLYPVACTGSGSAVSVYHNSISCLLFYSNYPLRVSVLRPSSCGNIYIGN
jgi:hypothetical protein